MAFREISGTVDGVEYDFIVIKDGDDEAEASAMEFVRDWKAQASNESGVVALYEYPHGHPVEFDGECICRQHDLDHKPFWSSESK